VIRVGLVGAGGIGALRARALSGRGDFLLTVVADPDGDRARALAGSEKVSACSSYSELLERPDVDAVVVSTPPHLHEAITLDALDAGKHVLCEKPLSNSLEGCRRMVERARSTGRTLATGFNHRYFPAIRLVKEAVRSGTIGTLDHVRAFAGHAGLSELAGAPWLTDPAVMGGGTLMDNGIHLLDLTRYVLGEVHDVMGIATDRIWAIEGCEDNGFALLRSVDGPVATLHSTWTEWRGYRFWIAAYGDRGAAWAYYAPMVAMVLTFDRSDSRARRRYHVFPRLNLVEKLRGWQSTVVQT
jgi:predicted dehydrogenase